MTNNPSYAATTVILSVAKNLRMKVLRTVEVDLLQMDLLVAHYLPDRLA